MKKSFVASEIIPILNYIWATTLGNARNEKKTISDLGWGPLNYRLLDHPAIQKQKFD